MFSFFKGAPSTPVGPLAISNIQQKGCTLSWSPSTDDGGSRISSYIVEARESKRATWYQVDTVDPVENTYKVEKLIENNSYYFRVSAKNSIGVSIPLCTDTAVAIRRPNGAPDTPVPLLVSDIGEDNCTLEWKAPSWDGGEDLKGYILEMRVGESKDWKNVSSSEIEKSVKSFKVC